MTEWDERFVAEYVAAREEGATKEDAWEVAGCRTAEGFGPRPEEAA